MKLAAGKLDQRVTVFGLDADLRKTHVANLWCTIRAKESASPPMPAGLRTGARVDVWCRYRSKITQGQYIQCRDRVLHVTSARDPDGTCTALVLTCDEFIGQPATYRTAGRADVCCRVHLQHDAPYLSDLGQVTSYRTRAEVLIAEVGRPQVDDVLIVVGVAYLVTQYASETDDGVVRGLWLERID